MLWFGSEKKKRSHIFPMLVGALAAFGAYSAVTLLKGRMALMMQKLGGVFMKKRCDCAPCSDSSGE